MCTPKIGRCQYPIDKMGALTYLLPTINVAKLPCLKHSFIKMAAHLRCKPNHEDYCCFTALVYSLGAVLDVGANLYFSVAVVLAYSASVSPDRFHTRRSVQPC